MATASDVLGALRATLQAVSGYKEAQQLYDDHQNSPEVDRSWAIDVPDTTDRERMRGGRSRVTRLTVSIARRIKTPGPQARVAEIIQGAEAIRDAIEATTAAGVSGIRVSRTTRTPSADRSHYVIIFEIDCLHSQL